MPKSDPIMPNVQPPQAGTVCCERFDAENQAIADFIPFVAILATKLDETVRLATAALERLDAPLGSTEPKERTAEEGVSPRTGTNITGPSGFSGESGFGCGAPEGAGRAS